MRGPQGKQLNLVLVKGKRRNKELEENEDIGDRVDHRWGASGSTRKGSGRGGGLEDGSGSRMTMAALDQEKGS